MTPERKRYTGDMAYYAVVMMYAEAIEKANIMLSRPSPMLADLSALLKKCTAEIVNPRDRARLDAPVFRAMLSDKVNDAGISVQAVMATLKKYEQQCQRINAFC